jgi:hypothetical protein
MPMWTPNNMSEITWRKFNMSTENRIRELETELETIPNSLLQHDLRRKARILEELSALRRQQYEESQTLDLDNDR